MNELIKDADKLGGRPAVIDQLNEIGGVLRSASRDTSWGTVLDKL